MIAHFFDPGILAVVRVSVFQSTVSVLLSVFIGGVLGVLLLRLPHSARERARLVLALPALVGSVLVVSAFVRWIPFGWPAVVGIHVWWNAPWVAWGVLETARLVPEGLRAQALSLGAGAKDLGLSVYWPWVKSALLRSALQVYLFCWMSFGVVLILGGGPPVESLETAVYSSIHGGGIIELDRAFAAALWQLLGAILPAVVLTWQSRSIVRLKARPGAGDIRERGFHISSLLPGLWLAPLCVPVAVMVIRGTGLSSQDMEEVASAALVSGAIAVAVGASCAALAWALAVASRAGFGAAEWGTGLLAALSPQVLGFACFLLLFLLGLNARWLGIIFVQAVIFLPWVSRPLFASLAVEPRANERLAQVLGASRWHRLRWIAWPRDRKLVVSIAAFAAAASLGELSASLSLNGGSWVTLAQLWGRWMSRFKLEQAGALAVMIFAASSVFFFLGLKGARRWLV